MEKPQYLWNNNESQPTWAFYLLINHVLVLETTMSKGVSNVLITFEQAWKHDSVWILYNCLLPLFGSCHWGVAK